MNDGTSLDIGHYFSDVFDVNTVIWCHCDDDGTTQISGFLEGVYTSESHQKKTVMLGSDKVLLMIYTRTIYLIAFIYVFDKQFSHI